MLGFRTLFEAFTADVSMVTAAWFSVSRVSDSARRAIANARENKIRA